MLALRRKVNIKVRQPLSKIMIPVLNDQQKRNVEAVKSLIMNEVNVKSLDFIDSASEMLVKRVKPDFKKLGPRYGKIMKQLAAHIQQLQQQEINTLEQEGRLRMMIDSQEAIITTDDVEILSEDIPGWLVGSEGRLTVALDITITPALEKEGIARELVNRIQNLRKAKAFEITDRITIRLSSHPAFDEAVTEHAAYICNQVLADEITLTSEPLGDTIEIDEQTLTIGIEKNS